MDSISRKYEDPDSHLSRAKAFTESVIRSMSTDWRNLRYAIDKDLTHSDHDSTHIRLNIDSVDISSNGIMEVRTAFAEMINMARTAGARVYADDREISKVDDIWIGIEITLDEHEDEVVFEMDELESALKYIEEEKPIDSMITNIEALTFVFDIDSLPMPISFEDIFANIEEPDHFIKASDFKDIADRMFPSSEWPELKLDIEIDQNIPDVRSLDETWLDVDIRWHEYKGTASIQLILAAFDELIAAAAAYGGIVVYGLNERRISHGQDVTLDICVPLPDGKVQRFNSGQTAELAVFLQQNPNISSHKLYLENDKTFRIIFYSEMQDEDEVDEDGDFLES